MNIKNYTVFTVINKKFYLVGYQLLKIIYIIVNNFYSIMLNIISIFTL
jgi:hypothetical protein